MTPTLITGGARNCSRLAWSVDCDHLSGAMHHPGHCEGGDKSELFQHWLITRGFIKQHKKYVNISAVITMVSSEYCDTSPGHNETIKTPSGDERWGVTRERFCILLGLSPTNVFQRVKKVYFLFFHPMFRVRFKQSIFSFCDQLKVVNLHFSTVGCLDLLGGAGGSGEPAWVQAEDSGL